MSSERASRALLAASDSFGQMAALSWQQEQAKAQADREENMLRLRQKLSNEELDRRQGFDVQNEETRFQHNLTAAEREAEIRGKETKEERTWREQQARTERGWQVADRTRAEGMQRENWTRQDRDAIERQSASQISTIDGRILDIRDAVDEGDCTDATKAESEIKRLMAECDRVRTDTVVRLAHMGDPRYKEVKPPPGGEASPAPRAAQGPRPTVASVDVAAPSAWTVGAPPDGEAQAARIAADVVSAGGRQISDTAARRSAEKISGRLLAGVRSLLGAIQERVKLGLGYFPAFLFD